MRPCLLVLTTASLTWGCTQDCGSPQQLNTVPWDSFLSPLSYGGNFEDPFPAESSPINGSHSYQFDWGSSSAQGPVTVTIDDQPFTGDGTWSTQECGNFTVSWQGIFEAEGGATHAFAVLGSFIAWPGNIDGFLDWNEQWATAQGDSGSFDANALFRGTGTY